MLKFHLSNLLAFASPSIYISADLSLQSAKSSSLPPAPNNINGDVYVADGDYIKDIEVNDLRNRYTLTKGSTQKMVNTLL